MSSSIRKFKEDIENIEIPAKELENTIKTGINRGTIKKLRFKKIIYVSSVAVILFALLLGSGFVSPAMAKMLSNIPYLNSVLPYTDKGLKVANEKGLIKSIGETAVDQGIPITITDVYYDNSRLEIGYVIPLENVELGDLREIKILGISKMNIYLDGEAAGYHTGAEYKEDYIVGTIDVLTDLSQLSENPKIKLELTEVLNKQGQWLFEFDSKKAQKKTIVNINKSVESEEYTFTVNEMELTPSATKIEYEFEIPANLTDFNENALTFNLYSENGNKLELIRTGLLKYEHTQEETRLISELYFEPFDKTITNLTLIPIIKGDGANDQVLTKLEMKLPVSN
ncbi:MAG: DUF4179 domain-containing protein [Bacillota bacterium]